MQQQPTKSTLFPYTTLFRSYIKMINQRSLREPIICVLYSIECHLEKIKRKAIQAGYQDNTMIVLGVEYMLKMRSEEHTSELQSHSDLVCRLLLEKKKKYNIQ